MNGRYTERDAINALARLAGKLGKEVGTRDGNWNLDQVPLKRMWRIVEILPGGCLTNPISNEAYTAKELVQLVTFTLRVMDLK